MALSISFWVCILAGAAMMSFTMVQGSINNENNSNLSHYQHPSYCRCRHGELANNENNSDDRFRYCEEEYFCILQTSRKALEQIPTWKEYLGKEGLLGQLGAKMEELGRLLEWFEGKCQDIERQAAKHLCNIEKQLDWPSQSLDSSLLMTTEDEFIHNPRQERSVELQRSNHEILLWQKVYLFWEISNQLKRLLQEIFELTNHLEIKF